MNEFSLQYPQEHIPCKNYAADDAILQIRTLDRKETLNFDSDHHSFLCFLLQGSVQCQCNLGAPVRLNAAEMTFSARSDTFQLKTLEPAVVILCFFDETIALCNAYTIKTLSDFLPEKDDSSHPDLPVVVPVNDLLFSELDTTRIAMTAGLLCAHYQQEKRDIFLLMLRGFYSKETLSELFHPILSRDFDFKQQILKIYTPDMNVEEMIVRSGLPTTSFNRKFGKAFGTTPRQWLVNRKKKDILNDLSMKNMSIKEIACKYGLTPNYFNEFCRSQLGCSPSELRKKEVADL